MTSGLLPLLVLGALGDFVSVAFRWFCFALPDLPSLLKQYVRSNKRKHTMYPHLKGSMPLTLKFLLNLNSFYLSFPKFPA